MKLLATPKYLSDAITPLMTLNYLMGLRIVEYPRGKLRIVLSLIYSLILLSIYFGASYVVHKYHRESRLLQLEYVLYELMVYVKTVVITCDLILGCFYTKQLNTCYRKIAQIDETLRQLGSMFNYRKIYHLTIGAIIFWLIHVFGTIILTIVQIRLLTNLPTMIWLIISQVYGISISFFVIFEFSLFVRCLQARFKLVNELLSESAAMPPTQWIKPNLFATGNCRKIIEAEQHRHVFSVKILSQLNRQIQSRVQSSASRKRNLIRSRTPYRLPPQLQKQFQLELQNQRNSQIGNSNLIRRSTVIAECGRGRKHLLQTIRQVHLELCKVSKVLCTCFGIQITSEIGISIMLISGALYNLYIHLVQRLSFNRSSLVDQVLIVIAMALTYTLKMIIINRVCSNATNEQKKITEIIHAIYGRSTDIDTREEIQQFALQISQNSVKFFAFGVSLDYNVLSSCLGTVSTYLVIMIQMSSSLESSIQG